VRSAGVQSLHSARAREGWRCVLMSIENKSGESFPWLRRRLFSFVRPETDALREAQTLARQLTLVSYCQVALRGAQDGTDINTSRPYCRQ
jgi:hypothetical protein